MQVIAGTRTAGSSCGSRSGQSWWGGSSPALASSHTNGGRGSDAGGDLARSNVAGAERCSCQRLVAGVRDCDAYDASCSPDRDCFRRQPRRRDADRDASGVDQQCR